MHNCFVSAVCVAFYLLMNSLAMVKGQSIDSLLYQLNQDMFKDDSKKFELLYKIASGSIDDDTILKYSELAIKLAEKLNKNPAKLFVKNGVVYLNSGKLSLALGCFMKAANYYREADIKIGMAVAYTYMSEAYISQENYNNAKFYLKNAIEICTKEKDSVNLAIALTNLGYANYGMGQYDSALIAYSRESEIYQKLGKLKEYAMCLGNSGLVYSRQSEFDKAEDYLLRALKILTEQGDERSVTQFMIEYARVLQYKGEIKKAISFASTGFCKARKNTFLEYERDAAYRLDQLYQVSGKCDSAYYYLKLYINAKDSIKNEKVIQKMADQRTKFEVDNKQVEVNVLKKKKMIQLIVIVGLVLILLLAIGLILLYNYSLKRLQRLTTALDERNILLEKQSLELKEQRQELMEQKEEIISSINYAKSIQSAILPPKSYINELLDKNFIFYKPKEIVSGDFYWIKRIKNYTVLVAADCTGHGVPGAFMSMLGISLLNEIVERREITRANQILNEMREQIKQALRQVGNEEEPKDGMDLALCVIDNDNNLMQYSGANNPLYVIKNSNGETEFKEIIADPMPVGFYSADDESFSNHEIQLEIGDTFYIFSDGYIDQNGGNKNQRFNSSNFKKLLLDIREQPMDQQKTILEQTLKDWMGERSQRDDILVIGVKV